ncbi:MAG: GTP-binding protein [Flavobacteriales bacterium]|nr:GTP-binding protein [Flavobacteriales bacterium]
MTSVHQGYLNMELLRFITAGSVDDGKSTLIGRLLYDSKSIFADQMEAIELASFRKGEEHVNLALLTDGLRAEREQGITIDVAYRYFATPKRKFIIADTPGHIQYTRNMVTGASTANLAIVLVDARKGVVEQTKRHAYIASLLQIPHLVVCINKMDLVDFAEQTYQQVKHDFENFASKLAINDVHFVPICALEGDNVVNRSERMKWYGGSTLMHILENVHIGSDHNHIDARFPVQYVLRPMNTAHHDYRGYAGRVAGGIFRVGDKVAVLPSGFTTRVKGIHLGERELSEAFAPMSVALTLEDDIGISRGDMLVRVNNRPQTGQDIDLMVCWMDERPLQVGGRYVVRHTTSDVRCIILEVTYTMDINTLQRLEEGRSIGLNDIGRVRIRATGPLCFDSYRKNRATGSLIIIDEATNRTVGAGMIV